VLDHPAIVKVIPVEGRKSRPYLVMEYLEGRTLNKRMQAGTPLPEAEAARIGSRICEGLEHMHAHGIVHRDLKPENIMLCADGSLRIIDFGIAKAAGMKRITYIALSSMWGTPDYMAPEQVNGGRGDARSDIYSLGAVLYEMTTGRVPFAGENPLVVMQARTSGDPVAPRQVNDRLSPEIEEIILHAMERDPKDRFESATEMRGELEDYRIVKLLGRYRHLQPPQPRHVGGNLKVVYLILFFVLLQLAVFGLTLWHFSGRRH
jgi:serine/threonine-protein kinase